MMIKDGKLPMGGGRLLNEVVEISWGFNYVAATGDKPASNTPVIKAKTKSGAEHRVPICEENAHLFPEEYHKSAKEHGIKASVGTHHQNEIWDETLGKFVPKTSDNCNNAH